MPFSGHRKLQGLQPFTHKRLLPNVMDLCLYQIDSVLEAFTLPLPRAMLECLQRSIVKRIL